MKNNKSGIVTLAIALTVLTAGAVFAYGGYGMHRGDWDGHMMGPGYGGYMMGYGHGPYMDDDDYGGHLSAAQSEKLNAAQERFFDETRDLRHAIDKKQFALEEELNKEHPDKTRALDLQQQLSRLRDKFDQKALAHRIEIQKFLPDDGAARGYCSGYCW